MAEATIFALATPKGRSGIAVIRVSGSRSASVLEAMSRRRAPAERRATLCTLRDPVSDEVLDEALALRFTGPASFTGEDALELHVHGSPAVTRSVLAVLDMLPGLRPAEPGEFTRRALMNGRLDLAQVEGLGDLLAAETRAQAQAALRLMQGTLSRRAETWRTGLVHALALVEATIDFAEEDIPDTVVEGACDALGSVAADMAASLRGGHGAERLRDGFEVALVGPPNIGKSTLLNAVAGRDAALTSEVAGTTRDVIEVRLDLEGLPVTLLDMAGLHAAEDDVEAMGVARARERAAAADVRVFLVDRPADVRQLGVEVAEGDLVLLAKADQRLEGKPGAHGAVSGLTGAGIETLLGSLAETLGSRAAAASGVSRARQRQAIETARSAVASAMGHLVGGADVDLATIEIQAALRALEFLVGKADIEAVLDVVFREFCIGK